MICVEIPFCGFVAAYLLVPVYAAGLPDGRGMEGRWSRGDSAGPETLHQRTDRLRGVGDHAGRWQTLRKSLDK